MDKTRTMPAVPDTLTVVLADTLGTETAIIHENEHRPYGRRTVQVALTEKQRRLLKPQFLGYASGHARHEIVLQAWLEPATRPLEGEDGEGEETGN